MTKWKNETTTTLTMPEMTRRRKQIAGPALPETGEERTDQVRKFMHDLAELYDYGHYDVYDSVFFTRVGDIMVDTVFDENTASIRDLGQQILDTRSTSVKLYIAFFKAILGYLDTL
jgi:hypothetical protein